MRTLISRFSAAALAITAAAASAQAQYSSESSFFSANPGLSTISFAGQTGMISNSLGTSTSLDDVTFTGNNLRYVNTTFWGNKASMLDDRWRGSIAASFAPVNALGFYFASSYFDGTPLTFTAYNGAQQVYSRSIVGGGVYTQFAYFGIDAIGPVTSFRLTSIGAQDFTSLAELSLGYIPPIVEEPLPPVNQQSFAQNTVVPEPSSFALMLVGGVALVVVARRRRPA